MRVGNTRRANRGTLNCVTGILHAACGEMKKCSLLHCTKAKGSSASLLPSGLALVFCPQCNERTNGRTDKTGQPSFISSHPSSCGALPLVTQANHHKSSFVLNRGRVDGTWEGSSEEEGTTLPRVSRPRKQKPPRLLLRRDSRESAREGQGPLSNHDAYALFLPRHRDAPTRLNVSRDS